MTIAGTIIATIAGIGIFAVGVLYLTKPRMMADNFGLPHIPHESATPWLTLKGLRDLATGVVAGVLIVSAPSPVLGWAVLAFAIIPIGDAISILVARGSRAAALGIHGATAAAMVVGAVLLLAADG